MSRRDSLRAEGILLDTSFLLPILGFETSDRVLAAFKRISPYELYYNDISILEALWKIVKIIRGTREELSRIEEGIRAINEYMRYAQINGEALKNAIYMYRLGHRDMIDNILYSIALSKGLKLLTVDEELSAFVAKHRLPKDVIITPEDL